MIQSTWKTQCKFQPGTEIVGKWNRNHYRILKELGSGANGLVYLATGKHGYTAIKMSTDSITITSEVNVLKAFKKVQGSSLGPSLHDIDDWISPQGLIHFYAMEYIQGPNLLSFIQQKGDDWTGIMILQLLDVLGELHDSGWVFGDLKPENLIVSGPPPKIRCIDVGGTTQIGRAIKEFTEFFDRGYWGLGSRKAEPTYDLFSVAMLMINLSITDRFTKTNNSYHDIIGHVRKNAILARYEPILQNALQGNYKTAKQMKQDLLSLISKDIKPTRSTRAFRKTKPQKKKKWSSFLETVSLVFLTLLLYTLYIYGYIL